MYGLSIIILICQKVGSVGPAQQKIKLPSPNDNYQISTVCLTSINIYCFE